MEREPSFVTETLGSDEEYTPTGASTSTRTKRRGSRGRGASGRGRGRRGRGHRVGQTPDDLGADDIARIERLTLQRIAFQRDLIGRLDVHQARDTLEQVLERDPSVIFDVHSQSAPASPPTAGPPPVQVQCSWCICRRCREMPTVVKNKCCNQQPNMCISTLPHMEAFILQTGVLRLARRIWNELRAVADLPDAGEDNRQFRHASYRQFVAWQYGVLRAGHRVVIPSCCVWAIRDRFPDPHGQYRGFIPRRL